MAEREQKTATELANMIKERIGAECAGMEVYVAEGGPYGWDVTVGGWPQLVARCDSLAKQVATELRELYDLKTD